MSRLERHLSNQILAARLPAPEREYRFAAIHVGLGPGIRRRLQEARLRDWRFDFAWPDLNFYVEVDGGGWVSGRHNTGTGSAADRQKGCAALRLGWICNYHVDGEMIKRRQAITTIEQTIESLINARYR